MMSQFGSSSIVLGMRAQVKHLTRMAIVAALAGGALLGGGSSAQADPPPGWGPGEYGLEADFADIGWTYRGWYDGLPGNVHTGYVNVEEDDDVLTVELNNWFCPSGATPPGPYDGRRPRRRASGGAGSSSTTSSGGTSPTSTRPATS